jgi:predicted GTPase
MNTYTNQNASTIEQSLGAVERAMALSNDEEHAGKLRQLLAKSRSQRMYIAFCGHFSAGKSTLINKLCGRDLLPSGPIPTSANIVSLLNGSPGAVVEHRDRNHHPKSSADEGGNAERRQAIPLEQLEAYCVNGTDIESVEIRYPIPFLGDHAALLDTPGIDSTDDAHFMATQSALHLADAVFYVMDYNHVQSGINFAFTKRLSEWGKPLYLIINQIDKHRSEELSFAQYRHGVEQAFADWHIEPDGIIYLSLKQPSHPYNEWDKLQWLLGQLISRSEPLSAVSVQQSALYVAQEHVKWKSRHNEPEKEQCVEQLESEGREGSFQPVIRTYHELEQQLADVQQSARTVSSKLKKEISSLLDNASLMPAHTRDLAHEYLQSRKPGFKVGLLFTASKTTNEIERRLKQFYDDFIEKITAHIDWHLRDLITRKCNKTGVSSQPYMVAIDGILQGIEPAWLAERVNKGAVFSNEYTMTYTKLVSADVKALFRKKAYDLADRLADEGQLSYSSKMRDIEQEMADLSPRIAAFQRLQAIEREEEEYEAELMRLIAPVDPSSRSSLLPDLNAYTAKRPQPPAAPPHGKARDDVARDNPQQGVGAALTEEIHAVTNQAGNKAAEERTKLAAAKLRSANELLAEMPAMKSIRRSMSEKAERLENSSYTIALFGAFSAGKSSFANAFIGDQLLPVSPNPTTAAINKIVAPKTGWQHGTAKIKMKSKDSLIEDIKYSLRALGIDEDAHDEYLSLIRGLKSDQVAVSGKPHYAFLHAAAAGWTSAEAELGREVRADMEMFRRYVAEEEKSCFVEYIELYYSAPLTERGVILVDTPGADSIHARHTGVAFEYIKNADAVLFVTYYNHAFSQADREFLNQLGRVKDSFELDKMFFIVNAADLAASQQELDQVVEHLQENLLRHGIRHPRIYPVSSLKALDGKLSGDSKRVGASGILEFERHFNRFTLEELETIATNSAHKELSRSISVLNQWIQGARESKVERQDKADQMKRSLAHALTLVNSEHYALEQRLGQEIRELLYYVKQRVAFRFGEFYNMAFHPSLLVEDGRDIKAALRAAWRELVRLNSFEVSQEILATTLRIENYMNRYAREQYEDLIIRLAKEIPSYSGEEFAAFPFVTPDLGQPIEAMDMNEKTIVSHYKNAKYFFEGEGKSKLKQELEKQCSHAVAEYVEGVAPLLLQHYYDQYTAHVEEVNDRQTASLKEHAEGVLDALEMKIDLGEYEERMRKLERLLD